MISLLLVGFGRLGGAIFESVSRLNSQYSIGIVDPCEDLWSHPSCQFRVSSVQEVPSDFHPRFILFAIKPQQALAVLPDYSVFAKPNCLFLSVMAGLSRNLLSSLTGVSTRWVRIMPNLAARVGKSATVIVKTPDLSQKDCEQLESLWKTVGTVLWTTREEDLSLTTPLSGSSPALFFKLCQDLIEAAVQEGLSPDFATRLVVQTLKGCAALCEDEKISSEWFHQTIQEVASPGGVTLKMLEVFHQNHFSQIVQTALAVGRQRCEELSKGL